MITTLEASILRDVLDDARGRSVTDENQLEHDVAVRSLIERGLIRYNPERPKQRFNVTAAGRVELDAAERSKIITLRRIAKEWQ